MREDPHLNKQPNKNILYPEEETADDGSENDADADATPAAELGEVQEDAASEGECAGIAGGAIRRPLDLKRKAVASPSPRKPATRSHTPRSAAKGEGGAKASAAGRSGTPGSTQDDVSIKRRMLRAKLAEADSPLPPPTRMLPGALSKAKLNP